MPNVLTPEIAEKLRDQSRRHFNKIGFTGLKECYLGNGLTPPTVVVPIAERVHEGAFYVHEMQIDNKSVFQAICNNAGITYDNSNAGMRVWVGYPPGIDENSGAIPHILPFDPPEARTYTGGAMPLQIQTQQQQFVIRDRIYELKVIASTNAIMVLTAGLWRDGNTLVKSTQSAIVDLDPYIPSTSGKSKYVLLSIDSDLSVTITEGSEVDTASIDTNDQPLTVPDGELQLAWVLLENGQTSIANSDITNIQLIPVVFSESSIITAASDVFTSSDGTIFVSSDGTSFVSSGAA
jgi:hypothetical protein